jgi:nucleotide sugar dehydrogenase
MCHAKFVSEINCCVIGAGRIGLPIAVSLAHAGCKVYCLEKDREKVSMINLGEAPFHEEEMAEKLATAIKNSKLGATCNSDVISSCNVVISAIGTGLDDKGSPDLQAMDGLVQIISNSVVKDTLVMLKTTLPIGMTDKIADKISKRTGYSLDRELMVAFSPERVVEGKAMSELRTLPKILGAVGPRSINRAKEVLSLLGGEIKVVKDTKTAELCKLMDNAYRMTRFGFAADVAAIATINGIDAYEAINAANYQYERNNIPLPSIGVSGYCLTKDPYYLDQSGVEVWEGRGFTSTWNVARRAADMQTLDAFRRISNYYGNLRGKKIVIGGITYKENVDDSRLSHGRELLEMFSDSGADVRIWDPCCSDENINGIKVNRFSDCLEDVDCLVITVPHDEFREWSKEIENLNQMRGKLIFDGWGILNVDAPELTVIGTGRSKDNRP